MSVARKAGSKPLAFVTALMVVLALAIPFTGAALANHGAADDPDVVTLSPDSDSATVGTCNAFTIQAREGTAVAEGETIDVTATQSDSDTVEDLEIAFCDPDGAGGSGSNLAGPAPDPNAGTQTGNGATGETACDDEENFFFGGGQPFYTNNGSCDNSTGQENPANIYDQCFTDAQGNCTFGVTSDEAGTMTIEAWFDDGDQIREDGEPFDRSTKTWTGTGAGAATNIACTPASDTNPEGTRHEFRCTVTDANGTAINNADVWFDVTQGPNAEEVGQQSCPTNTDGTGQTNAPATEQTGGGQPTNSTSGACGYNDNQQGANNSPPGTDTITAWVNLGAQPGQPAPTNGPDAGEPTTTISKTFVGPGRTIDCEPETATNQVGTSHTITCTVRDVNNNPVGSGTNVTVSKQSGPGTLTQNSPTTDANGQVTATLSTTTNDATGTAVVRGTITANGQQAATECQRLANDPSGSAAGVCFDEVQKTWTRQSTVAQCNDGVDNDGDGRIDFPDDPGCADINDNTESPDPAQDPIRSASNITIRYDGNANKFKGAVGASRKRCQRGRSVILKKVRPGPNRTVGRDTTNRFGNWKVRKNRVRGRYYAVVLKLRTTTRNGTPLVCLRDRSVTIKLRRGQ